MSELFEAIPYAFSWSSLIGMLLGTAGGIAIGALPGLTATMGIAVLIPLTFSMEPLTALGAMAGIYNGAMYGGAIPAILLGIPGTPSAIATTFDGYPLAKRGDGYLALKTSLASSALGGMISALSLILLAPPLVSISLKFGPAEYFWVGVFGLATLAVLVGNSPLKGLISACLGLMVGVVGADPFTGTERFVFGNVNLVGGFHIVIILTGLTALPPAFSMAESAIREGADAGALLLNKSKARLAYWLHLWKVWLRSSIIGIIIGIIPGAGGNLASFMCWSEAKRTAKNRDEFGHGAIEGVAASECGNNADNSASLIPALALGVPGNAVAALILGGLLVHGMVPGPSLFTNNGHVVYGFMIQMFITSALMFAVGQLGVKVFIRVLQLPPVILAPMVMGLTVVGVYSIQNSMFDVWAMFLFGLLGYLMDKLKFPVGPAVLAVILGPMVESNLRRTLVISRNDPSALVSHPLSMIIALLTLMVLFYPLLSNYFKKRKEHTEVVSN